MEFTCAHCSKVFEGAQTDDEARTETIDLFGVDPSESPDDFAVICDECFQGFKVWYDAMKDSVSKTAGSPSPQGE